MSWKTCWDFLELQSVVQQNLESRPLLDRKMFLQSLKVLKQNLLSLKKQLLKQKKFLLKITLFHSILNSCMIILKKCKYIETLKSVKKWIECKSKRRKRNEKLENYKFSENIKQSKTVMKNLSKHLLLTFRAITWRFYQ